MARVRPRRSKPRRFNRSAGSSRSMSYLCSFLFGSVPRTARYASLGAAPPGCRGYPLLMTATIAAAAGRVAAEARRVLARNRQSGQSDWEGRRYDFVCPSTTTYPFQWLWDSAFHAIALLHVDPELAKQELRCLLQGAQPDGFIPHMLLWEQGFHDAAQREYSIVLADPYFTATLQPPVIARAVWRVYHATRDDAFLAEVLPKILRFFRWLKAHRDPDDDGLIAIIQPDESGLDASPKYDVLMDLT